MIGFCIGIILTIFILVLDIVLLCSYAFLAKITMINSFVIGIAGGIALYLCNRAFNVSFFSSQINPVVCLIVAVVLFIAAFFLQKTKPGFWIFAVIFSILWSFIAALTVHILITENMIAFWAVFAVSFIMNISSHIRSRGAEFKLA
ncbi:MAG: hypothetical protein IKW96_08230 [Ruminococcus sp.]|jgi:hypothetical protein|uniref:hypothetical protein n=1 Tax=Ruminococcus sp. TaxID=41978 RepID=UPI0025F0C068|nr:hypothetical protein [Ruminococcus sp.]MBR5683250.1 hypothetical protein [Ruminococcus sp.]